MAKKNALGEIFSVRLRLEEAREVTSAIRGSGLARPDWLRAALVAVARRK